MFGGGRSRGGPTIGVTDDGVVDSEIEEYLRGGLPIVLDVPSEKGEGEGRERLEGAMWTGIMGFSRDEKPWIGRVPDTEGVFVAAGFTGHGMPNAWLCGRAVAEMCVGSLAGRDAEEVMGEVCARTGLPGSYVLTGERMESVMRECGDVGELDSAEMSRGKREREELMKQNRLGRDW